MVKHSFKELLERLQTRIAQIEVNRKSYTISEKYDDNDKEGTINIDYDGTRLVSFHYLCSHMNINGKKILRNGIYIKAFMYPEWYEQCIPELSQTVVIIDEYFQLKIFNETSTLEDCLDRYLPVGKAHEKEIIKECLSNIGLNDVEVPFDTYKKVYLIKTNIEEFLNFEKSDDKDLTYLYKYTSLETYRNILNNGTFRMNSIIAMNDENETLWADLMTGNVEANDEVYYKTVAKNKNLLITSFTSKDDNATMWRLYGNQGKGICMAFSVPSNQITKVLYVSEEDIKVKELKSAISSLLGKGIRVEFTDMNEMKYYIKHSDFSIEGEYRYLYNAGDEKLNIASYGDLLAPYKDFKYDPSTKKFENLPFTLAYIIVGKNIPQYKTVFPLLVSETAKRFPFVAIYESKMIALR